MEGLYINGEKCNQDTLSKCTPNKGNILLTYDTLSRTKSVETILSSSDSDIIILDNGVGEKGPSWSNSREVETSQFTRNLKGLRTPSPRAIVTQWLQASPSCKTPENTQTIVVERTVEDKEQYASRPNTPSTFEMFDLGANRRNTLTGENLSGSGLSPNPASPETRRKQELCSYLQLMNMNSKSDKQRTKLRSNFNRRSNRVKNLIVQIEKRKLEERLNKEIEINTPENAKMAQHLFCLHPNLNLCSQTTLSLANDIIPLRESPESGAILQGFTPSLMPTKVRMRKIAFDIVMRRFITDETITINKRKRTSMNSDEPSDITSTTFVTKRPRQKLQVTAAIGSEIRSNKPLARRGSIINFNDERSDIRRITCRTKHIRSKLIVTTPNISKKKDLKEKIAEATKEVKTPLRIVKIKTLNRKIKQKRIKKVESGIGITLFEREINKINRIGRRNKISRFHNLRILNNRLKHKENLPNKKSNSIVANILKAKQGKSGEVIEHRNNGINKDAKLKKYHKKINEVEVVSRRNEENSENRLHRQSIQKKLTEIVDLSKNSSILDKNSKEENPNLHSVKKSNTPLIVQKGENPRINILIDQNEPSHKEDSYYLMDHTYAQTTKESSIDTNQEDYKNHEVSIEQPIFYGFTMEEQCDSNNFLNLISALHSTSNNETITENITKETDLCTLELKEDLIIEQELVQANFDNVVLEDNHLSDKIIKTDKFNTKDLDLSNQLIHYNMHDYYAQEGLNNFSNISDNSSTSNDDSSDSASIYSATSAKTIKQNTQLLQTSSEAYLKSPEIIKEIRKEKPASSAVAFLKEMEVPVNEALTPQNLEEPTTPDITEHLAANTNTDKMIIQTEPILNFIPQPNEIRPFTPTYIPFVRQDKTPSKTLHRNLTNNNNNIRRKAALLDSPSASCQRDNISTTSLPPNQSNTNNLKHCATLAPSDGRLLHAEYCAGQLIASQERLVTCWAQTPLGHILHSQDLWIARGAVARQQFGKDSVLKHMKNRVMIIDNVVSYVEIWVKEHRSIFRERPVADVFAVLYSWKMNQTVEKKLIQLENIKGSADDVQCIILKKSRSVLVSWSIQSQLKQTTVLHLYQLSPDYQRVLTIKELKSVGTKIQSLHTIEDSDDLIIGCGENCINIWNIENGYIVATLDMPDILPEPKCLWTLCNQGFVFLLQECNDGLLRLIAINGMKMKITWKNLKIFHPPKEYYNLQGVCLENGILISCYENGILSWNVQTSELLTEEPLPTEDMAPFSSPSCFLSDSHIVQLERNGQIQVSHVSYHLLTSCDLSV